ncbi:ATP-binding protein [Neobacillus sp. YIM B06451]|uniref:ATP-binding protein n=1 Tax=Neobacillus sp. YIM B06451 TaxID=3070994 RepID=UPI00292F9043|nr:ATP-binding protein [Neobacillus sp. YIM B06451]
MGIGLEVFEPLNGNIPDTKEIKRRRKHIEEIVINYPGFEQILKEIEDHHLLSTSSEESKGLFLKGEPGVGKSTLLKGYTKRYPSYREEGVKKVPVLYSKVPVGATPKSLASSILLRLGDPVYDRGGENSLTDRLLQYIGKEMCAVELIIIDEFQHLIDRDTDKVLKKASDWIKSFSEDAAVPILICGMPESENIFERNAQLDDRFSLREEMKSFEYESDEEKHLFRSFLHNLDKALPFSSRSKLADRLVSDKIYYATKGKQRMIKKILVEATIIALKSGKDSIDEIDLYLAYRRINISSRKFAINPFTEDSFYLPEEWENEETRKRKSGEDGRNKDRGNRRWRNE